MPKPRNRFALGPCRGYIDQMGTIGRNSASTWLSFVGFAWVLVFAISRCAYCKPAAPAPQEVAKATQKNSIARDPRYPARWWEPISKEGAPSWEIMPQEAGKGEVILSKRNELGLLSNFAATPFEFHGKRYASLEGFWQMMKYPEGAGDPRAKFPGIEWKFTRDAVSQMTAFDAKRAGDLGSSNMRKMGIDWVTFEGKRMPYRSREPGDHYKLIVEATHAKVQQNPEVKRVLLSTGDLVLRPDHHQEKDAPAAWRYYEILMKIRDELQHAKPAKSEKP